MAPMTDACVRKDSSIHVVLVDEARPSVVLSHMARTPGYRKAAGFTLCIAPGPGSLERVTESTLITISYVS